MHLIYQRNLIKRRVLFLVYSSTENICTFMDINRDEKGVLKIKETFFLKIINKNSLKNTRN